MRKVWARVVAVLKNPQARPFEVWLFRLAAAYVAVKLGISADKAA